MAGYKLYWQQFGLNQKGRDFVVGDTPKYMHIETNVHELYLHKK